MTNYCVVVLRSDGTVEEVIGPITAKTAELIKRGFQETVNVTCWAGPMKAP